MKTLVLSFILFFAFLFAHAQSDGTLDVTFDSDGVLTLDNGNSAAYDGSDLVIMADKGIIVGG